MHISIFPHKIVKATLKYSIALTLLKKSKLRFTMVKVMMISHFKLQLKE